MLAKVRLIRGGPWVLILALVVCLSLLPGIFRGTGWRCWLAGRRAAAYVDSMAPVEVGLSRLNGSGGGLGGGAPDGCQLKVYVYDFPRKFNFGLMQKDSAPHQDRAWKARESIPNWPRRSGLKKQHSVEYWLMRDLLDRRVEPDARAAVRVDSPEQADVFFVPFFSSLSFNKYGPSMRDPLAERDKALQEEIVKLLFKSRWWKRSGGRDHVVVIHHPNAFRFYKHLLNASIFIVADFGRSPPDVSSLAKDVVAPYTHVVPTFESDNQEDPFRSRTTILYFQGTTKRKDAGKVRGKLQAILQNKTGVHFVEGSASSEGIEEATEGMRNSKYCLHPAGDTPSSCRLFDAIASHCVPVIISDKIELPFENELNYSSFALFYSEEEASEPDWLLNELGRVGKERWLSMHLKVKQVSRHFEYQIPTKQGDAVYMIWRQLFRKVAPIKQNLHREQRLKISDWLR